MRRAIAITGLIALTAGSTPLSAASGKPRPEPLPRSARLDQWAAPSIEALVERLLSALAVKDAAALERLRISEDEYFAIIVPGSVDPGQPPQRMARTAAQYWWDEMDGKSRYWGLHLLDEFGGRTLKVKKIAWGKGEKEYAWFTGYRQLRAVLEDQEGKEMALETGSVARVRGRFKFVSYVRD